MIDISNLFGYADFPFAGSAVLEALGWGVEVPAAAVVTHAALRNLTPAIT